MPVEPKLVMLARLNSVDGFASFADALEVVGKLQEQGIHAVCEQSPGALMDSQDSYLLKVPVDQFEEAAIKFKVIIEV